MMKVLKKGFPTGELGIYLFSETDLFNQLAVVLQVVITQVSQKSFSFTNQLHQPAVS
jgi:hypothetical protein